APAHARGVDPDLAQSHVRHGRQSRVRRAPARGEAQASCGGMRTMPSWARVATRAPERLNTLARPRPRPPWELGESWTYSSHSSARTSRCHHIAWSRLATDSPEEVHTSS